MIELHALTPHDLLHLFGGLRPTLLLGSGISRWEPSRLPTGQEFTRGVLDAVFDPDLGAPISDREDREFLDLLLDAIPFEMLLERCPDYANISNVIASVYAAATPNPVHRAIAAMADAGGLHSIVTTNYDLGLDLALTPTLQKLRPRYAASRSAFMMSS